MSENVSLAGFLAAVICGGVILDWALFERFKITLGVFGDRDEVRYRALPFRRFFLVVTASTAVGFSMVPKDLLLFPFCAGVVLFVETNIYGV